MTHFDSTQAHLQEALRTAVPLLILEIAERGGPTDADLERVRSYQRDLGEHGEDLYFRSRKAEGTAERFNQTAEAIAVLSFAPGGVTVFGLHFDGRAIQERWFGPQVPQRKEPSSDA